MNINEVSHLPINHKTHLHRLMTQGTCEYRLDVDAAKERQLRRKQDKDARIERRRRILVNILGTALTAAVTIGFLVLISFLSQVLG